MVDYMDVTEHGRSTHSNHLMVWETIQFKGVPYYLNNVSGKPRSNGGLNPDMISKTMVSAETGNLW